MNVNSLFDHILSFAWYCGKTFQKTFCDNRIVFQNVTNKLENTLAHSILLQNDNKEERNLQIEELLQWLTLIGKFLLQVTMVYQTACSSRIVCKHVKRRQRCKKLLH